MTATTDIRPFASGIGANVTDLATYLANTGLLSGGYADNEVPLAKDWNRVLRQSSFMSAGLAAWMTLHNISVPDDGNLSALSANIDAALQNYLGTKATRFEHVTSGLTYTPTTSAIIVTGCGSGGGGGGGLAASFSGAGGSAGEGNIRRVLSCTPGTTLTIVLGRGGNGGVGGASPTDGSAGTATTISGLPAQAGVSGGVYTFLGGNGGRAADSGAGYCAGGASVGGSNNDQGKSGGYGIGAVPGGGGGSAFSPSSNPIIGAYPPADDYANGNGGRGSGGAGGYIGNGGENGGSGFLQIEETIIRT